jgi:hypothetical protein
MQWMASELVGVVTHDAVQMRRVGPAAEQLTSDGLLRSLSTLRLQAFANRSPSPQRQCSLDSRAFGNAIDVPIKSNTRAKPAHGLRL